MEYNSVQNKTRKNALSLIFLLNCIKLILKFMIFKQEGKWPKTEPVGKFSEE